MSENFTRWQAVLLCLLLAFATAAAYWQVRHFDFTAYDDEDYVTRNPMVRQGVTGESLKWAMTTTHFSYWHPLTWISHMADVELFGLHAGRHHLVNVLLHILATWALYAALRRLTGRRACSLMVAGLFALHPLHVESVAWIAERKDVLSTLFWFLTLWAYAFYVEKPSWARYGLTAGLFALGLMSKPMLVTVPCVLLLLDLWPLRRLRLWPEQGIRSGGVGWRGWWQQVKSCSPVSPWRLLGEKVPLLMMALVSSAITFLGVYGSNKVLGTESVSLGFRFANVPVSYARYLGKTILPEDLVVLYPLPERWETWQVAGASLLVGFITLAALVWARRAPYLLVGWLWYLGTLVPTIGIIPVGFQSMADRYTYVPLVGVFVMVVWGMADLARSWAWPGKRWALGAVSTLVLMSCAAVTWRQTGHWRNTETLFRHAATASANNHIAHFNLGLTLQQQGRWGDAIDHYSEAARIQPGDVKSRINLGYVYNQLGWHAKATNELAEVIRRKGTEANAHLNMGIALNGLGDTGRAREHMEEVLRLDPRNAAAHFYLGWMEEGRGDSRAALPHYRRAVDSEEAFVPAWIRLAWLQACHPDQAVRDPAQAMADARRACELTEEKDPMALLAMSAALALTSRWDESVARLEQAQAQAREAGDANALDLAARMAPRLRNRQPYVDGTGN